MDNRFYLSYVRLHHQASRDFRVGRTLMWLAAAAGGVAFALFHWWGALGRPWYWTLVAFCSAWLLVRIADYWRKASNQAAFEAKSTRIVVDFVSSDEAHQSVQER